MLGQMISGWDILGQVRPDNSGKSRLG